MARSAISSPTRVTLWRRVTLSGIVLTAVLSLGLDRVGHQSATGEGQWGKVEHLAFETG